MILKLLGFNMVEQEVLEMLTMMVEDKDIYTAGHSKRVALYCTSIAEAMSLSDEDQALIYKAGLLHDIGKILTPESILLKPRKYNRKEYDIIKNHSIDGEKMVSFISSFKPYASIIRHHHERHDGDGYPDGLKGEAIPLLSRIMSVADSFDAMTTNRIYKSRKTFDKALLELQRCANTQFDPFVVEKAVGILASFEEFVLSSQIPDNAIQEERFAYYFKDVLTNAYSGDYLNYFLQNNRKNQTLHCCYLIKLHHMQNYNEQYGWKCGDALLKEIVLRIKVLFRSNYIFRIFGDDFVVLNGLHVEVDNEEIFYKMCAGFDGLKISFEHFDLQSQAIDKWEEFGQ